MKPNNFLIYTGLLILFIGSFTKLQAQQVAITIDDVPNTRVYEENHFQSRLLQKLDSLNIPVTIFINESLIYRPGATVKNFEL
ncbi:MAG: polysaccharide deacetylase family protein, partial [Candidatus Cyclobacteriaceae bacterium M3_2C_046]